jgi:signal transduction histidine kinase/ActR/RegA family two-component response regulator
VAGRPFSLRTHLALVILGAVLPSALLTGVIVRRTLDDSRIRLEHRLVDAAHADAEALDREFNGTIRVLQTLAQSPLLDAGDLQGFSAEAGRAVRVQPGWFAVILVSPNGHQLVHTGVPLGEPLRVAAEPESVRQVVDTRQPAVGPLTPGQRDPKLRFPIRVPVERDGRLRYVLTAVMEPESLTGLVRSRLPDTEEWTRAIVDPGLVIAARSRDGERYIGRAVTPTGAARVLNPPDAPFEGTSLEGEPLYSSLSRSEYGWVTSVSVPAAVLDGPVRTSLVAILSGGAVLILGGLFSVLFVSRRVAREFAAAREAAAALAEGRAPAVFRPRVAEAQQVQVSLQRAAQLLQDRARERDEQLQRAVAAQARAEDASRTKDQFLAVLGHELRNPLAPALTALELMRRRGGSTLQRERDVLERQITHMTRLVDDLLDVSRLTRGKVALVKRRIELGAAIERAVDMARPLIEQHGHSLDVDVPGTGLPIDADEDRIVQVIVNLLTNAAKYTPPGGRLRLTAGAGEGVVEIACEDDGAGIAPELLPTIFEPFAQGPRSIARQQGGLGLGLMLARSLTELHGGSLRYETVVPHGSRFIVRLPLASASIDAEPPPDPGRDAETTPIAPRRVLLVDDNADGREMMRIALQSAGHEVASAAEGEAALVTAAALEPDVAVLDIGLPGIDGYALARLLREKHPRLRLIALTGYGQHADAVAAREAGFDAHCTKPVTVAALLDQIAAHEVSAHLNELRRT